MGNLGSWIREKKQISDKDLENNVKYNKKIVDGFSSIFCSHFLQVLRWEVMSSFDFWPLICIFLLGFAPFVHIYKLRLNAPL